MDMHQQEFGFVSMRVKEYLVFQLHIVEMKPLPLTHCNVLGCSSFPFPSQYPHPVTLTLMFSYDFLGKGKQIGLIFSENLTGSGSLGKFSKKNLNFHTFIPV